MTGDSILIRRKDVIAGKGIAIEPSGVSAAIRIINTEVDSERLLPVNPTVNDIPIYKQMDAEGNGEDVKLLIQSPATASQVADTAAGVVTHAAVTAHGSLGVDDHGLLFDGNTYLEIDKNNVQSILTGSNPWCFDLYITGSEEVTSSYVQIGSLFTDNNDYVINWGMIDGKVNAVNIPAWGTIEGFTAGEPHLLTIEHYIRAGASTIALYCDNVRRSVISNVILPTVNENLWIGKGPVGYFKGWLDYIRIRNTAPYQSSTITPDSTPYLAAGERWTVINLSEIEGGGGTTPTDVDWNDIQNKPSTFPPSTHTHIISDVTGLSDVAVKAHTHENKTTLDKLGEVNNKPTFNGEEIGSGVSSWNDLEDKPTTFPPSAHTHAIADVSGLQDSLDSKVSSVNGQTGTVTIPNASATEAGLMSAADKSKLDGIDRTGYMLKTVYDSNNDGIVDHAMVADAIGTATATQVKTAVSQSHTHENKTTLDKFGEVNNKPTFNGEEIGSGVSSWNDLEDKPTTFPPSEHTHAIADVTGLQSLLDGKAAVGHTHAAADVTGLATTLAGKVSSVNGLTPDDSGALVLPQATSGAAGLMAAADKLKLDTFTNYTEKSGTENSGYIRFPGGLIMQFGSKEVLTPEAFVSGSIVFPRSFVDKPLSVTASVEIDNLTNAPFAISLYAPNTISVVFSGPIVGLPDTLEKIVLHWMAIGIENKPPTNSDNV
jgi:hypothetical protein